MTVQPNSGTIPPPPWCTDDVCTTILSHTVLTTSGSPFRPSQTSMSTSATPRFFSSVRTASQCLAPSPLLPAHRPRMSRWPSTVTPIAT